MNKASKTLVVLLVVGFFFAAVVWFVFVSGYWRIEHIEVQGMQTLSREEVERVVYEGIEETGWKPWDKRNIFYVDEVRLAQQVQEALFAEEVSVDKSYPDILRLIIKERQRSVVVANKDQLLTVDFHGLVTGELSGQPIQTVKDRLTGKTLSVANQLPLFVIDLQELASNGYQIANGERIRQWIEVYNRLIGAGIKSRYLKLSEPASKTLYVKLEAGYDLVLDLDTDLDSQIDSYLKFILTKPKDTVIREYVDARIPGRVYLK